jgi:hypothetical protein
MNDNEQYFVGIPGHPWQESEKTQWRNAQSIKRSYLEQVVEKAQIIASLPRVSELLDLVQYNELLYKDVIANASTYPLLAFTSKDWDSEKSTLLVTGGVHGYETSGVHGALAFVEREAANYHQDFNMLVAFCISPWGYETINRWNPQAIDPNRSFVDNSPAPESAAIMNFVKSLAISIDVHVDLHETTDTDNSEFRPALAARDAQTQDNWNIPDGFYLVGDTLKPHPDFQRCVIEHVEKVTHIAPSDDSGRLIGEKQAQFGVINYATVELGLCAGFSQSEYCTTTEAYPDSPLVDDENCVDAQVAAVVGALNYVAKHL